MVAILTIETLHCEDPNDELTDEVMLQQDGKQFWPNDDGGFFSITRGSDVTVDRTLVINGPFTGIALFDQEDIGTDDFLGAVNILASDASPNPQSRTVEIKNDNKGSRYLMTFKVRSFP
ncbi:hypothetical protein ACWGB8_29165 [Kitasatospora sp. NPDC054939]